MGPGRVYICPGSVIFMCVCIYTPLSFIYLRNLFISCRKSLPSNYFGGTGWCVLWWVFLFICFSGFLTTLWGKHQRTLNGDLLGKKKKKKKLFVDLCKHSILERDGCERSIALWSSTLCNRCAWNYCRLVQPVWCGEGCPVLFRDSNDICTVCTEEGAPTLGKSILRWGEETLFEKLWYHGMTGMCTKRWGQQLSSVTPEHDTLGLGPQERFSVSQVPFTC